MWEDRESRGGVDGDQVLDRTAFCSCSVPLRKTELDTRSRGARELGKTAMEGAGRTYQHSRIELLDDRLVLVPGLAFLALVGANASELLPEVRLAAQRRAEKLEEVPLDGARPGARLQRFHNREIF